MGAIRVAVLISGSGTTLQNDGPMIIPVIREVDGAAADLHSISESRFMDMVAIVSLSAEGRDQGRMDVHDPAVEIVRDRDEMKETGKADEIGANLPA